VGKTVVAPDWNPEPICGGGLHGLLWGIGDYGLLDYDDIDTKGVVFEVDNYVEIAGNKIKAPKGKVVFVGSLKEAAQYIDKHKILSHTAGLYGNATAGNCGTATAGNYGIAKAGCCGTAMAGYKGTAIAGDYGNATAGYGGSATVGNYGIATVGCYGNATAGENGIIQIKYFRCNYDDCVSILTGYIGKRGLRPNISYIVSNGKFK
jgi:hypothetical protein